ncbi:hypothetical protein BH24BAC1_BH24BAC1_39430 [soil metagenome]
MELSLDNFEEEVSETILQRGQTYYRNGHVDEPEEIAPGEWEFTVAGTDLYTVQVQLRHRTVEDFSCTCPYDGPVCKHVVAVLYALKRAGAGAKKRSAAPRQKTVKEQIEEVLRKLSKADLDTFIQETAVQESTFRQIFLSRFMHLLEDQSKEAYARQIRAIVKSAGGRHGFIEYGNTYALTGPVDQILTSGEDLLAKGQPAAALAIAQAVAEEMFAAMNDADDSNGDIGGSIDAALELLQAIAEQTPDREVKRGIFQYALDSYRIRRFDGFDWHEDMLELAVKLATGPEETEAIFGVLEKAGGSSYEQERAAKMKWQLLEKAKGPAAAAAFLEEKRHLPSFRRQLLEDAFQKQEYQRAKSLAQEGIHQDEAEKPGLVTEWQEWLLKIAQAENNTQQIIHLSRQLFLEFRHEERHFDLLKAHVPPAEWPSFLQSLLRDLKGKSKWYPPVSTLARIYIKEQRWEELLELVRESQSLKVLAEYEKPLAKHFPEDLLDLYTIYLRQHFDKAGGRSDYHEGCQYLRRMKKIGGEERVASLVEELKLKYPRKPALQEELRKV